MHVLNGMAEEFKALDYSDVLGELYWLKRKQDSVVVRIWDVVDLDVSVPYIGSKRALVSSIIAEWYSVGKQRKVKLVVVATPTLSGVAFSHKEEIFGSSIKHVVADADPDDKHSPLRGSLLKTRSSPS